MQISFVFTDFMFHKYGHFDTAESPDRIPFFVLESGVFGQINLKRPAGELFTSDRATIEVQLEGHLKTESNILYETMPACRVKREHRFLSMTQVLVTPANASLTTDQHIRCPFKFDLQAWITHKFAVDQSMREKAACCNFSHLPLSMCHRSSPHNSFPTIPLPEQWSISDRNSSVDVSYTLIATMKVDDEVLDVQTAPIFILAAHSTDHLPTYISESTADYALDQQVRLHKNNFSRGSVLSIALREPQQVRLRPHRGFAAIRIPVTISFESCSDTNPSPLDIKIIWQLQILTTTALPQANKQAAGQYTKASLKTLITTLEPSSISTCWRDWKLTKGIHESKRVRNESSQTLQLIVPQFEIVTPTYWSPSVSRIYKIIMVFEVSGHRHDKIKLVAPLQVGVDGVSFREYIQQLRTLDCPRVGIDREVQELLPSYRC